jgi:hypothetical protein
MPRRLLAVLALALVGASRSPLPTEARTADVVSVIGAGSTTRTVGGAQYFAYGIALRNTSRTKDALRVAVHVALLGRSGLISVYSSTIPLIPARGTFYLGNEPIAVAGSPRAIKVDVAVLTGATQAKRDGLPVGAAHLTLRGTVAGTVTNPYPRPIETAGSRIYAVYYDARGKIVGGERLARTHFGSATIRARRRASFTAPLGPAVSPSAIGAVRISVVPRLAK